MGETGRYLRFCLADRLFCDHIGAMDKTVLGACIMGGAIAAVFYLPKYADQIQNWDWRDGAAFVVLGLLVSWCLSPPREPGSLLNSDGHERAGNGVAFLLGKKLRRAFRGKRR